jgi:hypothetical protein
MRRPDAFFGRVQGMRHDERGVAMLTVVMGMLAIVLMTIMIQRLASIQNSASGFQAREDIVLATTEAMLERYAAKLTIDPFYYQQYVDEAEAPRTCTDADSSGFAAVVDPGNPWFTDCTTWDYSDIDPADWYSHPLLSGSVSTGDDAASLIHVDPPVSGGAVTVTVAGRLSGHISPRVVQADIRAESVSEFARMVEGNLSYGSGAITTGKVYAGVDLSYDSGSEAWADIFAGDDITSAPTFMNGAEGFDSSGGHNALGLTITDIYPDPIDFDNFTDDLTLVQIAACEGGGTCLDPVRDPRIPSSVKAYLIETDNVMDETRLKVSYSTTTPSFSSCLDSEGEWWVYSQSASWTYLDLFDLPTNGALWANQHVVLGRNSLEDFLLDGALTVYAGDSSSAKNVIIGSSLIYEDGLAGSDVLGVIASDQIWINPNSVGSDRVLDMYGAFLNQQDAMHTALTCGDSGSSLVPSPSELNTYGSIASIGTGNMSCCFTPRNYGFDDRLVRLRPPLFPLLSDEWIYTNWRETSSPCWATESGCGGAGG